MLDGFMWALGFSGGIGVGVFAWAFALIIFDAVSGRKRDRKDQVDFNQASLNELKRRNDLSVRQVESLESIEKLISKFKN